MLELLKKIFGTAHSRTIARYSKIVQKINRLEEDYQRLSDEAILGLSEELKKRLENGATTDEILPEAYAIVKNVCRRLKGTKAEIFGYTQEWDMVPYDVQIIGAIAMHDRSIAEMQTGEGKTLTAAMPLYLHALTGKPVHLVTVNDYLASRDCEWIGAIFRWLKLSTAALTGATPQEMRREVYQADIVYGTASEFGFDYLRDNSMATRKEHQCQRGHYFAIIDESDSILIDEARTPLIISGPAKQGNQVFDVLEPVVARLVKLQKEQCHTLALEAKKSLESLGLLTHEQEGPLRKFNKEERAIFDGAIEKLWKVGKGHPTHKILRRAKENPDLRQAIEAFETEMHSEVNKEERIKKLAELTLTIDERTNDFEITEKGIVAWSSVEGASADDFVMLDLGGEYALIDHDRALSDDEKLSRKAAARAEDAKRKEKAHAIRQLARAHLLMEKDIDYIVQEGKVIIIDENTGRPQPGRRFSEGLHQAIEAKEGVEIGDETQTYATITLQNYFRLYDRLAGMTGTASTEAHEFKEIYKLEVLPIPSNKPCVRADFEDRIYMTEREKYQGILSEIEAFHAKGCPILIGTSSVEDSEKLSRILSMHKLSHELLNAKNPTKEAELIAKAGEKGSILVATNMAGRGTDIKLPPGVAALGGLQVIGTTRHHSRRIDRQLRGRAGRQGDPGSSRFFISFEDDLMRRFSSPTFSTMLQRLRPPEGEAISAPMLTRAIESAQKRIEQHYFSMRKHTLEYDDVMNKQRSEVYAFRNKLLHESDLLPTAKEALAESLSLINALFENQESIDLERYSYELMERYPISVTKEELEALENQEIPLFEAAEERLLGAFDLKINHQRELLSQMAAFTNRPIDPSHALSEIFRSMLLRCIDSHWQEHLQAIDHLRTEVGIRSMGQRDPLLEFKQEAFRLFGVFRERLYHAMAAALFSFQFVLPDPKNSGPFRERPAAEIAS